MAQASSSFPKWGPCFGTTWVGAGEQCAGPPSRGGNGGDIWVNLDHPLQSTRVVEGAYVDRGKTSSGSGSASSWGYSSRGSEMRVLDVEVFQCIR